MSKLFTKTQHNDPQDEVSQNAKLLFRAGFIHKDMAGVYSYLPLGLRVLKKIENIIRQEMNTLGAQEVLLTTLQDQYLWQKSGRWSEDTVDNWFKTRLLSGQELGLANTHEEPLADLLTHHVHSYKDLPLYIYQFQTKFRNELRAKSGIMRAREFIMKDLYSFSTNEEEFRKFYEQCAISYTNIFNRVGIGSMTYRTCASGGSFTSGLTDEFQTVSTAGEDIIFVDHQKKIAINKEVYIDKIITDLGLNKKDLKEYKAIEVGNIFPLGEKYSKAMGLFYTDSNGNKRPAYMGSYGIGLGRLMGVVAEVLSDADGLCWPANIAPFSIHLTALGKNEPLLKQAGQLYEELNNRGIETLYDDRADLSAGDKLADSDLLGLPFRVVVSEKTMKQQKLEFKNRKIGDIKLIDEKELYSYFLS